ncbi:MAG: peptidoglycan recognition family protein [Candidatus Gracilibacteria bacterium]
MLNIIYKKYNGYHLTENRFVFEDMGGDIVDLSTSQSDEAEQVKKSQEFIDQYLSDNEISQDSFLGALKILGSSSDDPQDFAPPKGGIELDNYMRNVGLLIKSDAVNEYVKLRAVLKDKTTRSWEWRWLTSTGSRETVSSIVTLKQDGVFELFLEFAENNIAQSDRDKYLPSSNEINALKEIKNKGLRDAVFEVNAKYGLAYINTFSVSFIEWYSLLNDEKKTDFHTAFQEISTVYQDFAKNGEIQYEDYMKLFEDHGLAGIRQLLKYKREGVMEIKFGYACANDNLFLDMGQNQRDEVVVVYKAIKENLEIEFSLGGCIYLMKEFPNITDRAKIIERLKKLQTVSPNAEGGGIREENITLSKENYLKFILDYPDESWEGFVSFLSQKMSTIKGFEFILFRIQELNDIFTSNLFETIVYLRDNIDFREVDYGDIIDYDSVNILKKIKDLPDENKTILIGLMEKTGSWFYEQGKIELLISICVKKESEIRNFNSLIDLAGEDKDNLMFTLSFSELLDSPNFQKVIDRLIKNKSGTNLNLKIRVAIYLIKAGFELKDVNDSIDQAENLKIGDESPENIKLFFKVMKKEDLLVFKFENVAEYNNLLGFLGYNMLKIPGDTPEKMGVLLSVVDMSSVRNDIEESGYLYVINRLESMPYSCSDMAKALYNQIDVPWDIVNKFKNNKRISLGIEDLKDFAGLMTFLDLSGYGFEYSEKCQDILLNLFPGSQIQDFDKKGNGNLNKQEVIDAITERIDFTFSAKDVKSLEQLHFLSAICKVSEEKENTENGNGIERGPFRNINFEEIDYDKIFELEYSVNGLSRSFSPYALETIRVIIGSKVGFGVASNFIVKLGQKFIKDNPVSYDNLYPLALKANEFASVSKGNVGMKGVSDAAAVYKLIGNFTLNNIAQFLIDEVDRSPRNITKVIRTLGNLDVDYDEVEAIFLERNIPLDYGMTNFAKGIMNLREGNFKYLFSAVFRKFRAKISKDVDRSGPASKLDIELTESNWSGGKGVQVRDISVEGREEARLIEVDLSEARTQLIIGRGDKLKFAPGEVYYPSKDNVSFYGSLAFTTQQGELTELAAYNGEMISYLVSADGKDALVIVNGNGEMIILDKRNLMLNDIEKIAGAKISSPNRKLDIVRNFEDYQAFVGLVKSGRLSMTSSMMLVANGKPEYTTDEGDRAQRRMLIQFNDGRFGILNSSRGVATNEMIDLAYSLPDVKYAVYMDTGRYNSSYYYESGGVHQLGDLKENELVSNIISFSSRQERLSSAEVHRPEIIGRDQWGAAAPKEGAVFTEYREPLDDVLDYIVVHHSSIGSQPGPQEIQRIHMETNGWDDIGYHFVIDKDGNIYEGRPITLMGAHAGMSEEANNMSESGSVDVDTARRSDPDYGAIGIVVDGDFNNGGGFNPKQREALLRLTAYLKQEYCIPSSHIFGHDEVKTRIVEAKGLTLSSGETTCPGIYGSADLAVMKDRLPPDSEKAKTKE